jgi:hypothetical protein
MVYLKFHTIRLRINLHVEVHTPSVFSLEKSEFIKNAILKSSKSTKY